jgi:hypothetical protein
MEAVAMRWQVEGDRYLDLKYAIVTMNTKHFARLSKSGYCKLVPSSKPSLKDMPCMDDYLWIPLTSDPLY